MLVDLDLEKLARDYREAQPFPNLVFDPLIEPQVSREVAASLPSFEELAALGGVGYESINETGKLQITRYEDFPAPVQRLVDTLGSPAFLAQLEAITGIEGLEWDEAMNGGGIHQTKRSGLLDPHVDFNRLGDRYRRLNLIIYLNEDWPEAWGGALELWDEKVQNRFRYVLPELGRAVLFETSSRSYHAVTPVTCPEGASRKSFAAYYYTQTPPPDDDGREHSTIFRARPDDKMKRLVQMPLERAEKSVRRTVWQVKQALGLE